MRWLSHLHADASVAQRNLTTLAIRIETLIITAHGQTVRPPRAVALGLALYVWSLADQLRASGPALSVQAAAGENLFRSTCAGCHSGEGLTGAPVSLDVVGTDPALGRSSARGTASYRVPSLRGVGTRGALLHDASLPDVDALFDPSRLRVGFPRHLRSADGMAPAVPGHLFGLSLSADDRAALVAYLKTL